MSLIKDLIKKLRKGSKQLYRSGWQVWTGEERDVAISEPESNPTPMGWQEAYTTADATSTITGGSFKVAHSEEKRKDERIEKKPVEVVKEIVSEEPKMCLENIDKQIRIVARRIQILKDECKITPRDEIEALSYLKARKKYDKVKKLFRWQIATKEGIDALCKKYKVRMVNFSGYYKNVPTEALDELEKYISAYKKVSDAEPSFQLIIDDGGKETRKDPILLATSPFGRWFYICGAWDKEIEIVDDLIYKRK